MGFAPGGGHGAVGEGAAAVAGGDGFADVGWEDPGGAADVQDAGVAAGKDGEDVRVAGDFADGVGVHWPDEGGGTGTEPGGGGGRPGGGGGYFAGGGGCVACGGGCAGVLLVEVALVDGDGDLGAESAVGWQFPGGAGDCAGSDGSR